MSIRFFAFAAALALLAGDTSAQEKKKDAGPSGPDMQKMMEHAMPGPAHKVFEGYVGKWDYTGKYWMDPKAEPMEMHGKSEGKIIMEGRFYTENPKSDDPAMPFQGQALWGYDNHTKKYFFTWIDSMTTSLTVGEGTYDAAKKTMTWTSESFDAMKGKNIKMKEVSVQNADGTISKTFYLMEGGQPVKAMELKLTRAK